MRALVALVVGIGLSSPALAQWSDDFNRPDGPIGGNWTVVSGTWAIVSQQGAHTSASPNEILQHNSASMSYVNSVTQLDVFAPGSASQFSGVVIGWGGADSIMVKIQDQVSTTAGFSNIGIYHKTSATGWGGWTGTGAGFSTLASPFVSGRLTVHFSDPDTLVAEIDTDFNGTPDQTYTAAGVLTIAGNLGTQFALAGWGTTALFDNWSVGSSATPPPTNYCTAGTSTNGCAATISASGNPSVTQAAPCAITINNLEGQKSGIVFYGLTALPQPWCASGGGTSFLCVKSPTQRTIASNSGGTIANCDGSISLDWNAFQLANPTALGNPWSAGNKVYVQGWYRDPPACKTTGMSDAVEMTYVP